MDWDAIKEAIGEYATHHLLPQNGLIGLGSGSTSHAFIRSLGKKWLSIHTQKRLPCIATSEASFALANSLHIPLISDTSWTEDISCTFDGADFVDISTGIAIKGLGGALLREKIVAASSKRFVLMVDERKVIQSDKKVSLTVPLEVARFGSEKTRHIIEKMVRDEFNTNAKAIFRVRSSSHQEQSSRFITDNGNYTIDVSLQIEAAKLQDLNLLFFKIPGVLETGIFIDLATEILIGYSDGKIVYHSLFKR